MSRRKKIIIIAVIAAVVVIAAGLSIFFGVRKARENKKTDAAQVRLIRENPGRVPLNPPAKVLRQGRMMK